MFEGRWTSGVYEIDLAAPLLIPAPSLSSPPFSPIPAQMESAQAFGVSVCLAHSDGTRRRLLLACVEGVLTAADVAIETPTIEATP